MKRKPNPYIQRYKKLHREKAKANLKTKKAFKKLNGVFNDINRAFLANNLSVKNLCIAIQDFADKYKETDDAQLDITNYSLNIVQKYIKGE